MALSLLSGSDNFGLPGGVWRWVALGFFFIALGCAGLAIGAPHLAQWSGFALIGGLGAVGLLFLYAVWPRPSRKLLDAQRLALAAAQANIAWCITGRDGAVLDSNPAYRRLAGTKDGQLPRPPELALGGETTSSMLYRLSRSSVEGKPREEHFLMGEGLELTAAVRPLGQGQAAWWFTPRLIGEPTLEESGRANPQSPSDSIGVGNLAGDTPLHALPVQFRDMPVGVALSDQHGHLIDSNKSFARFFAMSGNGAGRKLADLIAQSDQDNLQTLLDNAQSQSAGPIEIHPASAPETEANPNLLEQLAELHAAPFGAGEARQCLIYLIDISEQKALELKFAQSQKMQAVGQLAGGVAHDFNNLLTVIIGNSEFLLMRHPPGDPSFKELNEVHQNALRAAQLVSQLLAFSRKQILQPRMLALGDVMGELSHMLRRLLRDGVVLKLENQGGLWPVNADEAQLSNAIINLVVNARDAMPTGGTITITTANEACNRPMQLGTATMPPGDYVRITVRDTGNGIAPEHLRKIFDPFFTTKPVGQGTGLGLATVYGIVKQTGGYITVESEKERGTTFRIYLPRHLSESPSPSADAISATARDDNADITGQDTILLVEDEDAVRTFAARALRMRGYQVHEASGGEEGLEILRDDSIALQLLITDVVMPGMDGPTLVRHARKIRPDMKIMFMSGYAEEAFRRNEEKAEESHFLPKPFGLKQLAAKVKDVLSGAAPPASR